MRTQPAELHSRDNSDAGTSGASLRAVRLRDPRAALGMAVSYLMTEPVFAQLPFGQWSRVLVGQINRGHYLFVFEEEKVVGFVGWALATRERAEAWLTRSRDIGSAESRDGDIVLLNVWRSAGHAVNRFLIESLRTEFRGKAMIYSKRFYAGGRVRPARLRLPASTRLRRETV